MGSPEEERQVFIMERPGSTSFVLGHVPGDPRDAAVAENEHRANYRADTEPVGKPNIRVVSGKDE